jgi:hypothetical protein
MSQDVSNRVRRSLPERMKAPDRGESEASKTATGRRGRVAVRLNHQRMGSR